MSAFEAVGYAKFTGRLGVCMATSGPDAIIGADTELFVDANGGYTRKQAIRVVAAAADLDVRWFEEPVSSDDFDGPHLHAHVAAATPNLCHLEWFHDHVRIESMFFDGTLDPTGGTITPRSDAPGNGLTLRVADAEPYRVA